MNTQITQGEAAGVEITTNGDESGERIDARLALAFEDLTVLLSGLSVTVTRSYDSRGTDTADFGVGWDLIREAQ